jgi:hypothetical protein
VSWSYGGIVDAALDSEEEGLQAAVVAHEVGDVEPRGTAAVGFNIRHK